MENALGEPGKGFHEKRLGGVALYDTLGTIAIALATSYYFSISVWVSLIGWFVLGEILHWVFGVKTAFIKWIETLTLE